MKYIKKGTEPKSLTAIKKLKELKLKPKFENLPPSVIQDILQSLLKEQGHLCCFCTNEITEMTAQIIHFLPEEYFNAEQLDYNNMYLCGECQQGASRDEYCGLIGKAELIPKYIADPRCEGLFRYNTLGEILPSGTFRTVRKCQDNIRKLTPRQQMLLTTIEVLNLNNSRLKDLRKAIMHQVNQIAKKIGRNKAKQAIARYQEKDKTGKYKRFAPVVIYYLDHL